MPMTRGMEVACYVRLQGGATVADLRTCLEVRAPLGRRMGPACQLLGPAHALLARFTKRWAFLGCLVLGKL